MQEFLQFAAGVMGVDADRLSADTQYGQFEVWDSLMQMRLIMEIEDRYNIEIPIDEVAEITKLGDFYKYIQK